MYEVLSIFTGALIAVMIAVNGELSAHYGLFAATVLIHVVGFCAVVLWMLLRRERFAPKKLPLWYYLGGAIGVATVLFNNLAFGAISVSAILALSLLGQTAAALAIDQWGLLRMPRRRFSPKKLIGIGFMVLGILCILFVK